MRMLGVLILLLVSSVSFGAEVIMSWDAVTTRTDGEVITGNDRDWETQIS